MCRWAKLNVVKKRGREGVLAKQFYINSPHSFLIEFIRKQTIRTHLELSSRFSVKGSEQQSIRGSTVPGGLASSPVLVLVRTADSGPRGPLGSVVHTPHWRDAGSAPGLEAAFLSSSQVTPIRVGTVWSLLGTQPRWKSARR